MNRSRNITALFFTFTFLVICFSCRKDDPAPKTSIQEESKVPLVIINNDTLFVELSHTPKKRETGLMFRDSLGAKCGMLFIFERERVLSFWMKNTRIPLSIAFINRNNTIVDIQSMEPMTEKLRTSRFPAVYALEVNKGWFDEHNIKIGDTVSIQF
jgi:uncharacterized membrane protein (UPF0127 family)